jgi:hypothetical protein
MLEVATTSCAFVDSTPEFGHIKVSGNKRAPNGFSYYLCEARQKFNLEILTRGRFLGFKTKTSLSMQVASGPVHESTARFQRPSVVIFWNQTFRLSDV